MDDERTSYPLLRKLIYEQQIKEATESKFLDAFITTKSNESNETFGKDLFKQALRQL